MKKVLISTVCMFCIVYTFFLAGCENQNIDEAINSTTSELQGVISSTVSVAADEIVLSDVQNTSSIQDSTADISLKANVEISSSNIIESSIKTISSVESSAIASSSDTQISLSELTLSSFSELEDWMTGKNEFSRRHQELKEKVNQENNFIDNAAYFKLDEKFSDFSVEKIAFAWCGYDITYQSKSNNYEKYDGTKSTMSMDLICSYGEKGNLEMNEYFKKRNNTAIYNYIDVINNDISYFVKSPIKATPGGPTITWEQDGYSFVALFSEMKYTPELLDYCVAQKVDLNNIVK